MTRLAVALLTAAALAAGCAGTENVAVRTPSSSAAGGNAVFFAHVKSLKRSGGGYLAIVAGRNPRHRNLYDRARGLGYWIDANGDTVRSLDQQYQP